MRNIKLIDTKKLLFLFEKKLKEMYIDNGIQVPEWAGWVKLSSGNERSPLQKDWWFKRAGSILRKIILHTSIGISRISKKYSRIKNRGCKPERKKVAGRSHIRKIFQDLEKLNLVRKIDKKGRTISDEGKKKISSWIKEIDYVK